jgi:hypothetical protein
MSPQMSLGMNEASPRLPEAPAPAPVSRASRKSPLVWITLAAVAVVALGIIAGFLFLRARDYAMHRLGQPPGGSLAGLRDFSTSNSVNLVLGAQESGQGVVHIPTERDGLTEITTWKGMRCRKLNVPPGTDGGNRPRGYFYFALDPSFKQTDAKAVRIEVEYFSENPAVLALQYDANASSRSLRSFYTRAGPAISLDGAKLWETATFHIRDGAFENSQNGGADFRLEVRPPELCVRRVTVTRETQED